ncbi:MAG: hypothetical protein AB1630_10860 [bacterium]
MMKRLIWGLLLIGCGGCYKFLVNPYDAVMWPSGHYDVYYSLTIQSEDAKDITVYLPFPHYKGKPDMKILKWLKKGVSKELKSRKYYREYAFKRYIDHCRRNKKWYKEHGLSDEKYKEAMEQFYEREVRPEEKRLEFYSKIRLDLIDTQYGKMVYIYP